MYPSTHCPHYWRKQYNKNGLVGQSFEDYVKSLYK